MTEELEKMEILIPKDIKTEIMETRHFSTIFKDFFTDENGNTKRETVEMKTSALLTFILENRLFEKDRVVKAAEMYIEKGKLPNYTHRKNETVNADSESVNVINTLKEKINSLKSEIDTLKNSSSANPKELEEKNKKIEEQAREISSLKKEIEEAKQPKENGKGFMADISDLADKIFKKTDVEKKLDTQAENMLTTRESMKFNQYVVQMIMEIYATLKNYMLDEGYKPEQLNTFMQSAKTRSLDVITKLYENHPTATADLQLLKEDTMKRIGYLFD